MKLSIKNEEVLCMNFRNRRFLNLFLSLTLVIGIVLGTVPMTAFAKDADVKKLTIVHLNDVHGRVELDEREGAIGYARLKTKVEEMRKENPNLLLLNAGDTLHGTTMVNVTKGETMVDLMGLVGFDVMVPGNHDFNYGYDRLLELKKRAKFPMVGSNIVKESDGSSDFEPYVIKELENGLKVGIFGLGTEETKYKSHPDNTVGIKFENPVKVAKDMVKELEKENVDFIIALVHLGIEGSLETTSKEVAEKVEGIDLIVDGHSHEILNKTYGDTLLVQAESYTKNIGVVDIEIEDGKVVKKEGKLITFEEAKAYTPDEEIEKAIAKIEEINKPIVDVVVGKSKVELVGERGKVRTGETNLGNLITDAMLKSTDADVAFTNGGGIRATISAGEVKVNDILTSFPFTNTLAVIEVKGSEIVAALERGVDTYPDEAGHFPHVSGMIYEFNPDKAVGSRVEKVTIKGEDLDPNKTYRLVTNDFMASGGDGYTMFQGKPFVAEGGLLSDVLTDYFKAVGEVNPVIEGRVKITKVAETVEEPKKEEKVTEIVEEPKKEEKPVVIPKPVEQPKPEPEPAPAPVAAAKRYVVESGDVLWKIAKKFGRTYQELAEFNNIKNPHLIFPGQVILVP